nr:ribonuclease H-like domain-containing protein [Tanacetum cinerariifolium]
MASPHHNSLCLVIDEVTMATQIDEENIPSEGIQSEILVSGSSPRFQNTNRGDQPQTSIRRSSRVSKLPSKLNDFVFNSSVRYGLEKYVSYSALFAMNLCFDTTFNKSTEPKSYVKATQDKN